MFNYQTFILTLDVVLKEYGSDIPDIVIVGMTATTYAHNGKIILLKMPKKYSKNDVRILNISRVVNDIM